MLCSGPNLHDDFVRPLLCPMPGAMSVRSDRLILLWGGGMGGVVGCGGKRVIGGG